jgi:glyoxylate reductase
MQRPSVYVTRRIPEAAVRLLESAAETRVWAADVPIPRDTLLQQVQGVDGLLCLLTERIDAELLAAAPRLRVVANMAVGYDNVDVAACTARGVVATNTPGVLTETTADMAFALLMAAARRVVESERYVREGRWQTWGPMLFLGQDVHHATLGIVGLGRIGAEVARRARGFDMRVLYHARSRKPELERDLGVEYASLERLLRESDFVSLHVDLNPETRHLISSARLRQMKPTAVLVNTARGPVVDQRALYEALRDGIVSAAALDVTDPEPIPADDPLLDLPNVIVCPHIASASVATRTRMATLAAENLVSVLEGRRPPTPINWPE